MSALNSSTSAAQLGSPEQHAVLERFVASCEGDARVVAAFLGGSFASGKADAQSDLDIYVITEDNAYDDFFGERQTFMQRLGRSVYLEDFNDFGFDMVLFTFDNGIEGELGMARESHFEHIHGGPYKALVDKKGLLAGKSFPLYELTEEEQCRTLHQLLYRFWDNLSHFVAAMHRLQLWTAYGSLDEMRMKCLKLLRLKHDFASEHSAYSKVEQVVPEVELLPLKATCAPLEAKAMLDAAIALVESYRYVAHLLAAQHGVTYPTDIGRVVSKRLDDLRTQHDPK